MGRVLPRRLSELGWRIYRRMTDLDLNLPEIAAAAGVSPSTLYRVMRAGVGSTTEPRLRTKRRLAKALSLPMAQLFDEPQLEILEEYQTPLNLQASSLDPLERLMLHHFLNVKPTLRRQAARAVSFALADVILGLSSQLKDDQLRLLNLAAPENDFEELLLRLFGRLPRKLRRAGAKMAIRAMVNVEMAANRVPSEPLYRAMNRTNWSAKRMKRNRPALDRQVSG